jgi:plasmid stabilization system protein ParE
VKRRKVHYTTLAFEDLTALLLGIAERRGVPAAAAIDILIERQIKSLERMPDRGRRVPELVDRGHTSYRELIAAPYRIVYRPTDREVWVIAIVDGRRDLEELLAERAQRAPNDG